MKNNNPPKYNQLLETGASLFQKYGLKRITVEEICKVANISKMTFYKFFKNKQDLVNHIWDIKYKEGWKKFDEIEAMNAPFTEKVQMILKLKEESAKELGPEFMKEYAELVPEFLERYSEQYQESMQRFADFIKDHQKKGEVRASMRPDFFLKAISKLMELAQDRELLESYDSIKDFALEINNFMFYGIMPPPKTTEKSDFADNNEN